MFEVIPTSVLCAILCGLIGYFIFRRITKRSSYEPPGPPGFPIIGNLLDLNSKTLISNTLEYIRIYGKIYQLRIFSKRIIYISDAKLTREILSKRPKTFRRPRSYDEASQTLSIDRSLFFSNGSTWSRMRRLTAPAFSHKNVANMSGQILAEAQALLRRLDAFAQKRDVMDAKLQMQFYTVRVISRTAFGTVNKSDASDDEYVFSEEFVADLQTILCFLLHRVIYQFPRWMWIWSSGFKYEVAAVKADKKFTLFCREMIERRQKAPNLKAKDGGADNMIELLIAHTLQNQAQEDKNGVIHAQDCKDIIDNVKVFYLAGSETTSVTLSWVLFHLAQSKALVEDIRREVDAFCGKYLEADYEKVNGKLFEEDAKCLHLAMGCFQEAMRLYPPARGVPVQTEDEVTEEHSTLSNGICVAPQDVLFCFIDGIMLDAEVFTDPSVYNPYRWLEQSLSYPFPNPTASPAAQLKTMQEDFTLCFGSAARICPGMKLALTEGVLAIVAMTSRFDFELDCPPEDISRILNFTTQPNKLPIRIIRRSSAAYL